MIRWYSNISLGLSIYVTSASALCDGSNPWFIPIFHLARWNNLTIHRVWLVHIASWIIPGLTFKGLFIQFTNNHLCVPDTSWPHTSFCSSAAGSPSPSWPWDISFSRNKWKLSQLLVSSRLCSDVIGLFQYSYKILNDHITFPWPFRLHKTQICLLSLRSPSPWWGGCTSMWLRRTSSWLQLWVSENTENKTPVR